MSDKPFIPADHSVAELSIRAVLLAVILTVLLAMSNAYLALKLGILTSASIPAAIISMGILRFFKNSTILENNAVQTAASAGEAVAGGIVYTIPALVIVGYWTHFDYLTNCFIAACGGVLGVLFSIPLRRLLVNERALKFPEGRAIAEVLKSSADRVGVQEIFIGGALGAVIELLQLGFKLIASSCSYWFVVGRSIFSFGLGFSATMIGTGYLVGQDIALSILLGAGLFWLILLPIVSQFYPEFLSQYPVEQATSLLWSNQLRYVGIGAMLFAGIWTFLRLIRPLLKSIYTSLNDLSVRKATASPTLRTDKDIPMHFILMGIALTASILFLFFQEVFPLSSAGLNGNYAPSIVFLGVIYVLVIGFFFAVITAYFSGLVGVTASPGSSIVISGMLLAAWGLLTIINHMVPLPLSTEQIEAAEAITIIIGSVVTGIAAIANDNTQDLKVGQLVGATPWKQQVMLLLGVLISSLVIPPVMQLLFDVYGIAGVMPRAGMDVSQSLPAPAAALMAAITEAVFNNALPWNMMLLGGAVIFAVLLINRIFCLDRLFHISILGLAIGMYLPLASSIPLFFGGMIALIVKKRLQKKKVHPKEIVQGQQKGSLIACGLVAGSALMDVLLAIPFSITRSPDVLTVVNASWHQIGIYAAIVSTAMLAWWMVRRSVS